MSYRGFMSPAAIAVTGVTIFKIITDVEKREKVIKLITNKSWGINLLLIIVFCYYGLTNKEETKDSEKYKEAIRTAILGVIIAILAYLDLTIAPFWIIFVSSYYMGISG